MAGKELTLGVVFSGRIGKELETAVARLETLVKGLNNTLGKIQQSGGVQALASLAKQTKETSAAMTVLGNTSKAATAVMSTSIGNAGKAVGEFGKAMTRAQANGSGFVTTLQELTKHSQRNTLEVKDAEKAMYKTDGVLRQLNREVANGAIQTALSRKNWGYARDGYVAFKDAANLTTISQKVLNGEVSASRKGISEYIERVTQGAISLNKFDSASKNIWPSINKMNKEIDDGTKSWQAVSRAQSTYHSALNGTLPSQQAAAAAIAKNTEAMNLSAKASVEAEKVAAKLGVQKTALINKYADHSKKISEFLPKLDAEKMSIGQVDKAMQGYIGRQNEHAKATNALINTKEKLISKYPELRNQVDFLSKQVQAGNITWAEGERALKGVVASHKAVAQTMAASEKTVTALNKQTTQLTNQYPELGSKIKSVMSHVERGNITWTEAQGVMSRASDRHKALAQESQALEKAVSSLSPTVRSLGERLGVSNKDLVAMSASTKSASEPFNFLGKQIGSVNGAIDRLKAAFKVTAAYGIAATAIYSVINAFKIGTQSIIDYDQALKNLQAITGATDAEVVSMGETIRDVARTTKFSTTEVAEGMVLLGQAGFSAGEAMDSVQATANLATGTLSDMKFTTDLLTTTIRAFNMDTIESGRVADVMANAINKSKLTIDKLRISFSYIAATAAQAGLSLEETAASMMVLANNGLRASTIGTGFRQVLARLLSPNAKLREAYEAHGIALDQINPKTVGYQEALKNLSRVLYNAETRTVDVSKAFELFGLRGAQSAAILVRDYAGGAFQAALKNVFAVGTSAEMAATQSEGLGVKLKNLADRAKLVALGFGDAGISGAIGLFVDVLKKGTEWLEAFAQSGVGQVIIKVGLLTTAFVALRGAAVFLMSAITGLKIIQTITTGFAMATAAVTLQTGAVTGLAVGVNKLKAAMLVLWAVLRAHPFAMITTIMATVAVVISQLAGASDKLAMKLSQQAIELQKVAKVLGIYADTLGEAEKGSDEYNAALERFKESNPEVTQKILDMNKAIDLADISTKDLTNSMKELATAKTWESVEKTQQALKIYTADLNSGLAIAKLFLLNMWDMDAAHASVTEKLKKVKESQDALVQSYKYLVEVGAITIDQAFERIDAMGLEAKKAQDLKDAFQAHFRGIRLAGEEAAGGITRAFEGVPDSFRQLYGELDVLSQARLLKAVDAMQKEVAAYRKSVKDMGIAKWDAEKQIEAIQEEAYRKFVETLDKGVAAEERAAEKRVQAVEKEAEGHVKALQKIEDARQNLIDKLRTLEERLYEDLKKIQQQGMTEEQKYNMDRIEARGKLSAVIKLAAEADTQSEVTAAIEMLNEVRGAYSDLSSSVESAFGKNTQAAADATREIKGGFAEVINSWKDLAERLNNPINIKIPLENQKLDLDEVNQKVAEIKAKAEEPKLFNLDTVEADAKTDATERKLNELLLKIQADKKYIVDFKGREGEGTTEKPVTEKVEEVKGKLDELSEKAEDGSTKNVDFKSGADGDTPAGGLIEKLMALINKVQELIDKLNGIPKVVTSTVKVNTVYTSSGFSPGTDPNYGPNSEPGKNPYGNDPFPGFTGANVRSKGGGIGGYGGGDTVPAMLEKGEFVIRKEAVQKYGAGMFANLNSMVAGMKIGGPVARPSMPVVANQGVHRFSQGGQVTQGYRPGNTINITLSPTFMTGDKNSVRQAATMLRDEIRNIDHRYGVN